MILSQCSRHGCQDVFLHGCIDTLLRMKMGLFRGVASGGDSMVPLSISVRGTYRALSLSVSPSLTCRFRKSSFG